MAIPLLAAQKVGHLSLSSESSRRGLVVFARSGCRRPYWQEIRVSYIKSSCDVISRDLFLCDSSLFSVERINEKIQFLPKPNQTSTFFLPTCEK